MKDWLDSLEPRERNFVLVGAAVVAISILYAGLWVPFDDRHQSLKTEVESWSDSLAQLKPLRSRLAAAPTASPRSQGQDLSPIVVVDRTLTSRGLDRFRTRSRPTTSNGIVVEFENIAFDDLVLWLGDLSGRYAMHVQAGTFSGGTRMESGRVNASVTLERAL